MALNILSLQLKIWIVKEYYKTENAAEVQRRWRQNFNEKKPHRSIILKTIAKFESSGSVSGEKRTGRTPTVITPQRIRAFAASVDRTPTFHSPTCPKI